MSLAPAIASRTCWSLTVLSNSSRRNARPNPNSKPEGEAEGKITSRIGSYWFDGKRRVLLDEKTSIQACTLRRSLQFVDHGNKFVGHCVGYVACFRTVRVNNRHVNQD